MWNQTAMLNVSIRDFLQVVAILLLASAGMSAYASQPELNEKARAAIEAATEKDSLDNGCFVIRSNDNESGPQQENVICPTVDIPEENGPE